ncbi:MAG: pyruvate dehydrogenase (acetyl-transferring) E1 component subunit alpha, partial [Brevibacterium sp.]|nr:pyruvate dehydrogenase (acetyl-transferring) E1 component subunit alpha [Brevibacterium sp.]
MTIDVPTSRRALPPLQPVSFIGADGRATDDPTEGLTIPSDHTLLGLYQQMVQVRRFEAQVT